VQSVPLKAHAFSVETPLPVGIMNTALHRRLTGGCFNNDIEMNACRSYGRLDGRSGATIQTASCNGAFANQKKAFGLIPKRVERLRM